MTNVNVTTKCEECGALTDEGFHFGGGIHYFCDKHEDVVFTKVTGKASRATLTRVSIVRYGPECYTGIREERRCWLKGFGRKWKLVVST